MKAGILTLSDKGAKGEREDLSGPALRGWLEQRGVQTAIYEMIPDEADLISAKLVEWADSEELDIILTTGGTGVSPRDVTPEATALVLDRVIPGIGELMRMRSLAKTPSACLSRAIAGIRGRTLIVNLPGSPQGVRESLEVIRDGLLHGLDMIAGRKH